MLRRVVCSVVLGLCLGSVTGTDDGAAVKQEVEDIFRTVERHMTQGVEPANPDSKTVEATMKEKIFVDHSGERDNVDELPVSPKTLLSPAAFPVGIIMADNLYPLVVGKNVDSGKPFVMNLNKQQALVVARASAGAGGDYKLLIPFPVMVGNLPGLVGGKVHDEPTPLLRHFATRGPYLSNSGPTKLRSYDDSEDVPRPRDRPLHYQSYRQLSAEDTGSGEYRPALTGKKYLSRPYNVKRVPQKVFYPPIEKPGGNRGYDGVYSKQGVSHAISGPKPNGPLKSVPLAYRQPPPGLYQYANPTPRYPYPTRPSAYPPVNYAGAYASVPKDFRPSPYLGNITEDPEPPVRQYAQPQSDHYENYDDRPYDFTEQDYMDSINSPGAHSSIGGVHHVTHHVDDYLGKIYEDMYYKMPPPPHTSDPNIDRQGKYEIPSASNYVKVSAVHSQNKTEASSPKTDAVQARLGSRPVAAKKHTKIR